MEKMLKSPAGKTGKTKSQGNMTDTTHSMLHSFFTDELKDIYWAEKKLVKSLPKLQKAATNEELKTAFAEHLEQTKEHVARIEQVFELLGETARAKKCEAMDGLTKEAESVIEDTEEGTSTRDVGLIIAAQKAEHYEIATYGGLVQLANTLGLEEISGLLQSTLDEEKETDQALTDIAESKVNHMSLHEEEA
jgi:ferritin-like metal-binding protein YciE